MRAAWVARACGLLAAPLGSDKTATMRQAKVTLAFTIMGW